MARAMITIFSMSNVSLCIETSARFCGGYGAVDGGRPISTSTVSPTEAVRRFDFAVARSVRLPPFFARCEKPSCDSCDQGFRSHERNPHVFSGGVRLVRPVRLSQVG